MREIKFRAWNKEEKRMYFNVQKAYDMANCHNQPNNICDREDCDHDFIPSSFGEVLSSDEFIVMQFTGLRDKNGVEIFEGDILGMIEPEIDGEQNYFGRVQVLFGEYDDSEIEYGSPAIGWYVEGYYGYKRQNGKIDKYNIGGNDSHWSLLCCTTREGQKWEIIGNIYENHELLR